MAVTEIIPPGARRFFVGVLVAAALAAFVYFMARGVIDTFNAEAGLPKSYGEFYVFVGTAITGLVGAVFAVAFGVPVPKGGRTMEGRIKVRVARVGSLSLVRSTSGREIAGFLYVAAYVLAGAVATFVRFQHENETPALMKSVSAAFLGSAIAIVAGFFGVTDE